VINLELVQAAVFSVDDPAREIRGVADKIVAPIAVGTLVAWPLVKTWARAIEWQLVLAITLAIGTLLTATAYLGLLTFDGPVLGSISAVAFQAALMSVLFVPIFIILGPIVIVCLFRARRGHVFLSALALCGVSVFCVVLQYFWLEYFLSG
jgi:hypothetical protein